MNIPRVLVFAFMLAAGSLQANDTVWVDEAVPSGATTGASSGDSWNWVTSSPAPYSGTKAHQSALVRNKFHEHYFAGATTGLAVGTGDVLFAHVYLDPANPPTEVMLAWHDGANWEHRAYWGANRITQGTNNTASRYPMGALPSTGQWVRLEVPAAKVGLEGKTVRGMRFMLYSGRATWDRSGVKVATVAPAPQVASPGFDPAGGSFSAAQSVTISTSTTGASIRYTLDGTTPTATAGTLYSAPLSIGAGTTTLKAIAYATGAPDSVVTSATYSISTSTATAPTNETVWFDDALPPFAVGSGTGGDGWNWISSGPTPFSGTKAHQSNLAAGLHDHSFNFASPSFPVATGDKLSTYVYLDPVSPPREIMLSWVDQNGSWEHRAYWGANLISYGTDGSAGRYYMGPLPPMGQWVRLEVPASAVALEGRSVQGMGFSLYDGRATWDRTGIATGPSTTTVAQVATPVFSVAGGTYSSAQSVSMTTATSGASIRYTLDGSTPTATYGTVYSSAVSIGAGTTTLNAIAYATGAPDSAVTSATYAVSTSTDTKTDTTTDTTPAPTLAENTAIRLPQVGDHQVTIVSPMVLELRRITTKEPDPATVTDWNFVSSTGALALPSASKFTVLVNGQSVSIASLGFRRRVAYAPEKYRDLRIDNCLYLKLGISVPEGATIEVKNADATLWPATMVFKTTAAALRYSPAIHVNQEGYAPSLAKKAMVGYYLGNLGELEINAGVGFKIVQAATGATVFSGALTQRRETGFVYTPQPYQQVFEADFTALTTAGEYQLVVPGLGASLPFLVNDGVPMAFTRTYALGIYHQRCGAECKMPYSRFEHAACHMAAAEIPSPQSSYSFTWTTIASRNADAKNNPRHTAPQLKDEASQLYPFVNKGTVSVTGGHHDAGDYSKYTTNVAQLVHLLGFAADSIAGADAMDNLGLPESGDGINDFLQMAKHESDFLAKLQDADGGFYFIVYPKERSYEGNVTPDRGDSQVVWPKNTAATAAATAALAQMASSPKFKATYPTAAANYLNQAKLGWQFLINAITKHGKDGAYQKLTHYGDNFMHDDELAWAAAALFVATGEAQYHQKLMEWFPDPSDANSFRYWWWRMCEGWGNAIRAYSFAARSGRLPGSSLNSTYLAKCDEQIALAAADTVKWSNQSAYGSSFPEASKHYLGAGWFFSLDQAFDLAVATQLGPKPEYTAALLANLNYEAGTNPVNVTFVSGLGLKRQREIVHQWANTDHRKMPMPGIPVGNITGAYSYVGTYGASGNELAKLSYPTDDTGNTSNMYPFYDRWADTWNVTAEFITVNQARALGSAAAIANLTASKSTAWKPTTAARIIVPTTTVPTGQAVTLALDVTGLNLGGARILWEARDHEPDFGSSYTITPKNHGTQWVEVEITWPDGRRMFGKGTFEAVAVTVIWVDDAVPAGASLGTYGGDSWTWVTSGPTPISGSKAHQTAAGTGLREHFFNGAWTAMPVGVGDTLFAWVYLDPAAPTEEIMLHWNDGTWEHRAYWGANKIHYGTDGTASRRYMGALPAAGQWVKLEIPASAVGLEGRNVTGMSFSAFGGKVTWDAAGRTSAAK